MKLSICFLVGLAILVISGYVDGYGGGRGVGGGLRPVGGGGRRPVGMRYGGGRRLGGYGRGYGRGYYGRRYRHCSSFDLLLGLCREGYYRYKRQAAAFESSNDGNQDIIAYNKEIDKLVELQNQIRVADGPSREELQAEYFSLEKKNFNTFVKPILDEMRRKKLRESQLN